MKSPTSRTFRVSSHIWPKREFDPSDATDLIEYKYFLENSSWKNGCPFIVEWPFLSVIDMIKHKIVFRHIDKIISTNKKLAK